MSDSDLSNYIYNWSRWARETAPVRKCGSAESRWNSDWWNGWRESLMPSLPPDLEKAFTVESVLTADDFVPRYRQVLVLHSVRGWSARDVCRRLKARPSDWYDIWQAARGALREALLSAVSQRRILPVLYVSPVPSVYSERMTGGPGAAVAL